MPRPTSPPRRMRRSPPSIVSRSRPASAPSRRAGFPTRPFVQRGSPTRSSASRRTQAANFVYGPARRDRRRARVGADLIVVSDPAVDATRSRYACRRTTTWRQSLSRARIGEAGPRAAPRFSRHARRHHARRCWPHVDGSTVIVEASAQTITGQRPRPRRRDASSLSAASISPMRSTACRRPPAPPGGRSSPSAARRWHAGKTVVMGRAAYTSHFSVGLDVRSHLEDAEALADAARRARVGRRRAESLRRGAASQGREPATRLARQPELVRARRASTSPCRSSNSCSRCSPPACA